MLATPSASFDRLLTIIRRLRSPEGCPWDRAQTPQTLRGNLVDEAWECVSAIDAMDDANMQEELGDLYLMVTMMAWMKEQEGSFSVAATLDGISDKLIRRHPHIFADAKVSGVDQVLTQWDEIKAAEKKASGTVAASALDRVPRWLPPLERAAELQKKAAKVGFDWPDPAPVWEKISEEMAELQEALDGGIQHEVEAEIGDLLFTVVNLSRALRVDPALALHRTNTKFDRRFREVEARLTEQGVPLPKAGLARMDALWDQVKAEESAAEGKTKSK